jgi:RNA recognition motif-containing protein
LEVNVATLFMVNVPHNCSDEEISTWVNSSGIPVKAVRTIRDTIAGVSPCFAYVDIYETMPLTDAVRKLNGQSIRERVVMVSAARPGKTAATAA